MKITIIDDDAFLLRALKRLLHDHDVATHTTPDGPAIAGADVVVADWRPHGLETVALCREFKVPVLVLTASPELVPVGVSDYVPVLEKPIRREPLLDALKALLDMREVGNG